MIKKFSVRAQKLLTVLAQEEGKRMGNEQLFPEHLVAAIIRYSFGNAFTVFARFKLNEKKLLENIEQNLMLKSTIASFGDLPPSRRTHTLLDIAHLESRTLRSDYVGTEHIFLAALREEKSITREFFMRNGIGVDDVRRFFLQKTEESEKSEKEPLTQLFTDSANYSWKESLSRQKQNANEQKNTKNSILKDFSRDLTEKAKQGLMDSVIGREKEVERIIQILCRRTKNNPILVGEPGVGKTAIVELLAQKIVAEDVPQALLNKRLVSLDLASVIAGTKYRGEFEERIKRIIQEIQEDKNIILFIDELHTLIGAGGSEGSMDASNMLKPALSRGELQCIGATTEKEYRKYFEKDAALERRFQLVSIQEPETEETIAILNGLKKYYEDFHGVTYAEDVIPSIVKFAQRYIPERFFPDKALDILDEVGSMKKIKNEHRPEDFIQLENKIELLTEQKQLLVKQQKYEEAALVRDTVRNLKAELEAQKLHWKTNHSSSSILVTVSDVCAVLARITGIPLENISESENQRLLAMEDELHKKVIGQHEAIRVISSAIRRSRTGVSSGKRPLGSFIFLGPTGVGKTLLAKTLAQFLFGKEDALIRVDMSDYMEKHNASRLVGSPPGYVGYEEGGFLTEKVRKNPYSVILLDEIEKAHSDVFNLLLQILEEGELRDNLGHLINFRNTVIIMTSNAGSRNITYDTSLGFSTLPDGLIPYESIKTSALQELKRIMSPELLNRIDDTVVFNALSQEEITEIFTLQCKDLEERLRDLDLHLKIKKKAQEYFVKKGYDYVYGARPMRRLLQQEIEDALSVMILSNKCKKNDILVIDYVDEKIKLKVQHAKEELLVYADKDSVGIDNSIQSICEVKK